MHIENIKSITEKLAECAKSQLDMGVENVDTAEMGAVVDMLKDLCEASYYAHVVCKMDEADEEEELLRKIGVSEDGLRYYRGQPRNVKGEYKADGRENREYNPHTDPAMLTAEMYGYSPRGMRNVHYYGGEDGRENGAETPVSGMETARRNYEDYRRNHSENAPAVNSERAKHLESLLNEVEKYLKEVKPSMSSEEKTVLKAKMTKMSQALSA